MQSNLIHSIASIDHFTIYGLQFSGTFNLIIFNYFFFCVFVYFIVFFFVIMQQLI